jgi:hypothetical protein
MAINDEEKWVHNYGYRQIAQIASEKNINSPYLKCLVSIKIG